jgi:hypothetical protein
MTMDSPNSLRPVNDSKKEVKAIEIYLAFIWGIIYTYKVNPSIEEDKCLTERRKWGARPPRCV